jgi:hypothetical protein
VDEWVRLAPADGDGVSGAEESGRRGLGGVEKRGKEREIREYEDRRGVVEMGWDDGRVHFSSLTVFLLPTALCTILYHSALYQNREVLNPNSKATSVQQRREQRCKAKTPGRHL